MPGMALFPDPDHAAAFQRKGLSLPRVGRYREAMEILERAGNAPTRGSA